MNEKTPEARMVWTVQLGILALFWVFVIGIITWILRLIRLSLQLDDIPSASIGISLVAIPVFLLLLGVASYVVWGIPAAAKKEAAEKRKSDSDLGERHES